MGAAPNRRLVWLARLGLCPLAFALIVLAWHQRQARSAEPIAAVRAPTRIGFAGVTGGNGLMTAVVAHGRLLRLKAWYTLPCHGDRSAADARDRGWFWLKQDAFAVNGQVYAADWGAGRPFSWRGHRSATATMDLEATLSATTLTGSFAVHADPQGHVPPACHARATFTLTAQRG
jgi:hypothetical protein